MRKEMLEAEARAFDRMVADTPNPNQQNNTASITLLIVVQVLMGMGCIIGGGIMAANTYRDGAVYVIAGLIAGVFMFTLAVVTSACKKYLDK